MPLKIESARFKTHDAIIAYFQGGNAKEKATAVMANDIEAIINAYEDNKE